MGSRLVSGGGGHARPRGSTARWVLAAVSLLAAGAVHAQVTADPAADGQTGQPMQTLPIPFEVANNSGEDATVLWTITNDLTNGAQLNLPGNLSAEAGKVVAVIPNGGTAGPTLTLGGSPGTVDIEMCEATGSGGFYDCSVTAFAVFDATAAFPTYEITRISPDPVQTTTGEQFSVVVEVRTDGTLQAGEPIRFSANGAPLSPVTQDVFTDPSGVAQAFFTATAGGTFPAGIAVEHPSEPLSKITYDLVVADDHQMQWEDPPDGMATTEAGQAVQLSVRLLVNGVDAPDGTPVAWDTFTTAPKGGVGAKGTATVDPLTTTVGGVATTTFSSSVAGMHNVSATWDPNGNPSDFGDDDGDELGQSFQVDVTAASVKSLTKPPGDSGDGQSGQLGETLPLLLKAIALDNGVAAPDVTVSWSTTGDAQLSDAQTVTGTDGSTSISVTLGQTPGPITITATRQDAPSATTAYVVTAVAPTPSSLTLRKPPTGSGDRQSGTPNTTLPSPLVAVAYSEGFPDAGVPVDWTVVQGSASVSAPQTTTDAEGRTQVTVTLGPSTGPVKIVARRADEPSAFVEYDLNVVNVEQLTIVGGADQQPVAGEAGEPLSVRFTRNGVPVRGVAVTWSVQSGDATVDPTATTTNAQGIATTGIAFGPGGGPVVVQASAADVQPAVFRFEVSGGTGPPPPGIDMKPVGGDDQIGLLSTRADQALIVEVRDGDGNPREGIAVEWRVLSGQATLDASQVSTDAQGRASIGFRFGSAVGPVVIRASAFGDLVFVDFSADAVAPTLAIISGDGQQGPVSEPLPEDFVVGIGGPGGKGAGAKALDGVTVTWTVLEGGGTLESPTSVTDADGHARNRLTLGPEPGVNRVAADVPGGGRVVFTATGIEEGGELVKASGDGQNLPTETLSQPLVVELRDAAGDPLAGQTLLWSADNATLEHESTVTDSQGRSSNRARISLSGAATVTVDARDVETEPVVFALNGGVVNTAGLDGPQREVAEAIDALCPALSALASRTPEQEDLLQRCLELVDNSGDDPAGVADALEEMLNDVALTQVNAALVTVSAQFDNLKARIAAIRSGARGFDVAGLNIATSDGALPLSLLQGDGSTAEAGADFGRWGFFASGTIGRGKVDAGSATPKYDFDSAGLTAGADYRVSDRWIVGAALGYARHDTEVSGGEGRVDTSGWSLSAYTTWFNENSWYVDGVLTWGSNDYELERRIRYSLAAADGSMQSIDQLAKADSDGSQISTALSFGRDFQRGAWNFGPYVRGSYARVEFDDYVEALRAGEPGSGLGLAVDARDVESLTSVVGGKLTYTSSRDWGVLMPHLNVEWEHEYRDDPQSLAMRFLHDPTSTPIEISGDALDSDYFNVGVGLSALFPGGKSGFLYYEHLVGASGRSQGNLAVGLRIEF